MTNDGLRDCRFFKARLCMIESCVILKFLVVNWIPKRYFPNLLLVSRKPSLNISGLAAD